MSDIPALLCDGLSPTTNLPRVSGGTHASPGSYAGVRGGSLQGNPSSPSLPGAPVAQPPPI